MPGLEPEPHRGERHGKHAEDDGAGDFARREPGDEQKAPDSEQDLRLGEIAELDEGDGVASDEAGILQPDQREEQADARGDAELQIQGKSVDQPFAQRRERDGQEQHPGEKHASKGELPIAAELRHHGEGEIGVEPHAGRERDGVVGVEPHDGGADGGGEAGRHEHGAMIHAGLFQDRRVHEHDVGHGEEGGEAGAELGRTLVPAAVRPK